MLFSAAAGGGETPLPAVVIRLSILCLALAGIWRFHRFFSAWLPLDLPVLFFLLYAVLATGWAAYPWAAYQFAMNMLCVGLVYLLVRGAASKDGWNDETNRIMAVLVLAATVQVVWQVYQYSFERSARPGGSFANPNILAGFLFFGVFAAIHLANRKAQANGASGKVAFLGLAALLGVGIVLARSRAMVPVAAGVFLFLVLSVRGRKAPWLAGAGVGTAVLLAATASRFSTAADPYALGRLAIWKAAWKTALVHPFGVGLGGFKYYWLRFREPIEGTVFRYGKTAATAHSQFFGVLSELGFPGILLALAVVFSLGRLMWRESRREDRILALCLVPVAALIQACFDVPLDAFAVALPVSVCTALLVNRNAAGPAPPFSLSAVLRGGLSLVLLPCIVYAAMSGYGLVRYQQGLKALKKGDANGAMTDFSRAAHADPLCSAYPDGISSVYFRWYLKTGRTEYLAAAVNAEQQAVTASPQNSLHLSQTGFLLNELADAVGDRGPRRLYRGLALSALDASLKKDPYSVTALLRKADILRRGGDVRAARAVLEGIVRIEPNAASVYLVLARSEETEDPRKAAAYYRKALALSAEFDGKPLEPWQQDLLRVDRRRVEARLHSLENGHFGSDTGGQ